MWKLTSFVILAKIVESKILMRNNLLTNSHNIQSFENSVWPNGRIPFNISDKFADNFLILDAMVELEELTCVSWVKRKNETDYVFISMERDGCYATLGYNQGSGKHILNLGVLENNETCLHRSTILHEMMHTLGFGHEHQRPDRDDYIKVIWKNINSSFLEQYFKMKDEQSYNEKTCDPSNGSASFDDCTGNLTMTFCPLPYDSSSVTHYTSKEGSINGQSVIIPKLNLSIAVGARYGLSSGDIDKINYVYNCSIMTTPEAPVSNDTCADYGSNCKQIKNSCKNFLVGVFCQKTCGFC